MPDTNDGESGSFTSEGRRVLDALPERILICTASGEIAFANRLAAVLLGRSPGELRGQRVTAFLPRVLHEIDSIPFLEALTTHADERPLRGAIVHARGVQIEVDFVAAPFEDAGLIALTLRRIAEHAAPPSRWVEDTVRAETYRLVFEDAPLGIFHFDERGVITTCNEPFVRIIGSSKRVLVGLDMRTLPFPPIVEAVEEALRGKLARYEGAYPSATSDKVTHVRVEFAPIVSEDGKPAGGVGIAEDVTDRVNAEQALRRAFESLRTLLESAPDAIAVHRENRFVMVNPAMVRMLGYASSGEVLATPVLSTIHPEDRSVSIVRREDLVRRRTVLTNELRLLRKDGAAVVVEVASIAIHYENEPAILTFARDVTERRRIEARLAQADRMASIGTLSAGVAHEINNPLTYVMGNLDILDRRLSARTSGGEGMADILPLLRDAREGCDRMRSIVRDLRTFSRSETEERSPLDLRLVIDGAIKLAQHEIKHRARLVREVGEVSPVFGDQTRLTQVVLNLLINAAQAMPEGHRDEHTIRVALRPQPEANAMQILVHDDGAGIPPEAIDRVFEPFFTTKPVGVGTGLGLSICRGIVQAHGGSIDVESVLGHGATFRVTLPLMRPARVRAPASSEARGVARRARIVVIDDELELGKKVRAGLEPHDVVFATSGREGLELLLSGPAPDLILCDVMMPDVSGVGVYEALRRDRPDLCDRFVFLTGGVFSEASLQFVAGPAVRRLHKPFAPADVERLLVSLVGPGAAVSA